MKLVPMSFNGVRWHHNPRQIVFECDKSIKEYISPAGGAIVQNTGRKNMLVKGEGELYGADCIEQFEALLALFKRSSRGVLSIPKLAPIYAEFEALSLIGLPKPDVLSYSFVFREVMEEKTRDEQTHFTPKNGECLWDISHKFGVSTDKLVKLNPKVKRPDIPLDGMVITLC